MLFDLLQSLHLLTKHSFEPQKVSIVDFCFTELPFCFDSCLKTLNKFLRSTLTLN